MSSVPWLLGGGALAAYLWSRDKTEKELAQRQNAATMLSALIEHMDRKGQRVITAEPIPTKLTYPPTSSPPIITLPGDWVWPLGAWNGRAPVISSGFGLRGQVMHKGVDVMFRRHPSDPFAPGTPNGSKGFVMPDDVHVLAAQNGYVWSAMQTPRGFAVVIDHLVPGIATFYQHLEKIFVKPTSNGESKEYVRAGQPIGTVGFSPLDGERLKHLHFEIWRGGHTKAIDPILHMPSWGLIVSTTAPGKDGKLVQSWRAVRNSSLMYRPLGASGHPYPQWVRDLKGESGVYVIRDRDSREVVYVGSSVGRLYDTLTRHLQTWRRFKGYWKGQYAEGHDPGLTYDRDDVEVAVRITRASDALDEESRLIQRLRPRDNLIGRPVEDVPF